MNANLALEKLIEGNKYYVQTAASGSELSVDITRDSVAAGQKPFAIILGCSDSRVPAELIFNQGLGDLFVIRVAGNIVAPSQIGSVEFACQQFGTQLVVVLGHSQCGAVAATVDALTSNPDSISPNIASIVDRVTPAVMPVVRQGGDCAVDFTRDELIERSVRANVEYSVRGLTTRSEILRRLVDEQKLKIVGAEYSLESGVVDFHTADS